MKRIFHFTIAPTAIGNVLVVASPRGLCALRLVGHDRVPALLEEMRRQHPDAELREDARILAPLVEKIEAVIGGRLPAAKVPLDLQGTPFQKRVWQEMVRLPWGRTATYTDLAKKVGKPLAVRAVAGACARNPVAFVVPCHRIVRKGGGLGGYYWGLERKKELLAREVG